MKKYAMVFAAGLGTRLGHITQHTPKALVQIAGKPLLYHIISKLYACGFNVVVVNTHHHSIAVLKYLHELHFENLEIMISDETEKLLETGGGLLKAAHFFKDADHVLLHNADIVSDIDLNALFSYHCNSDNLATLAVKQRKTNRYFLFDDFKLLKGWKNTSENKTISFLNVPLTEMAFSGIQVVSKKIFEFMPGKEVFSLSELYLNLCINHRIEGWQHNNDHWVDVGKPEHFSEAEKILRLGEQL